ncbi:MAG: Gx transporter family protein [Oscillospiraceae bacterium]|nr:Gx transporter family protein [Oscillospiraceae bacterium]
MRGKDKARKTAGMGMLFALALVLQFLESLVPVPFPAAPGIKLGLSNTVTMFCLFTLGVPCAVLVALLKGVFAFITRGPVAGVLSLAGGILSVIVMHILDGAGQSKGLTCVSGAVSHNIGQLAAECVMMKSSAALYYIPVLTVSGVVMGTVTAYVFRSIRPYLDRIYGEGRDRQQK